jgi:hypothetical protein
MENINNKKEEIVKLQKYVSEVIYLIIKTNI